jgi:hypothetical protein
MAVVLGSSGKLESREGVLSPLLEEWEVLVSVDSCGVCYRDIIDRYGGNSFVSPPIVLGHEIAGIVTSSTCPGTFFISYSLLCSHLRERPSSWHPRGGVARGSLWGMLLLQRRRLSSLFDPFSVHLRTTV